MLNSDDGNKKPENEEAKTFVYFNKSTPCQSGPSSVSFIAVHANEIKGNPNKLRIKDKLDLIFPCGEFDHDSDGVLVKRFLERQEKPITLKTFYDHENWFTKFVKGINLSLLESQVRVKYVAEDMKNIFSPTPDNLDKENQQSNADGENIKWSEDLVCGNGTFIFLDLETTDLSKACKITELCMIAVKYNDLVKLDVSRPDEVIKHVEKAMFNSLVLVVDPVIDISYTASYMTDLENCNIERSKKPKFDKKTVELMESFMHRLQAPLTLLAFNGSSFDFPRLDTHLKKINYESKTINNCYWVDPMREMTTLHGIKGGLSHRYRLYTGGNTPTNAHYAEGDVRALMILTILVPDLLARLQENKLQWGVKKKPIRKRKMKMSEREKREMII